METSIRKNKDISSIDGGSLYISKDIRENVCIGDHNKAPYLGVA